MVIRGEGKKCCRVETLDIVLRNCKHFSEVIESGGGRGGYRMRTTVVGTHGNQACMWLSFYLVCEPIVGSHGNQSCIQLSRRPYIFWFSVDSGESWQPAVIRYE